MLPPDLAAAVDILGADPAALRTPDGASQGTAATGGEKKHVERIRFARGGKVIERRVAKVDVTHAFGGRDVVEHGKHGQTPWWAKQRGGAGTEEAAVELTRCTRCGAGTVNGQRLCEACRGSILAQERPCESGSSSSSESSGSRGRKKKNNNTSYSTCER
eukprot:TRINITY_DN4140_c0_g3_i6.p4 TRINITY_DN4140_c0_g3~~TRINITY_DN4140_c0_g3_i6.p4  ORF type:complete len:160 (+),score=40.03 TRINITY_DN4140_c0_g3_i6:572-1051(+)